MAQAVQTACGVSSLTQSSGPIKKYTKKSTFPTSMAQGEYSIFVDDADTKAAIQGENFLLSKRKTVAHLEKGAQFWAELISATGGTSAHHKSVWKILWWWDHVYPPTLKKYLSHNIILNDGCGVKTTVLKHGSSELNKGLGYLQAPNTQQSSEFTHRLM